MSEQSLSPDDHLLPSVNGSHKLSNGGPLVDTGSSKLKVDTGSGVRKYTVFDQDKALDLLIEYPKNVAHICRVLGVGRKTWDYHIRTDPWFAERVQEIEEAHCDDLEGTMLHLGKQKTSFNFNDRIAYLRAHRPHLYNPARKIIVEGYKLGDSEAQKRSQMMAGAIDAQIVNAYTTRKERLQAKRERSSLLPSSDQEGGPRVEPGESGAGERSPQKPNL
jgi:hypothetical protein